MAAEKNYCSSTPTTTLSSLTPSCCSVGGEEKKSNEETQRDGNGRISLRSPPSFVYDLLVDNEDGGGEGHQILDMMLDNGADNSDDDDGDDGDPSMGTAAVEMSSGASAAAALSTGSSAGVIGPMATCICSSTSQLLTAAGMDGIPPAKTPANSGPDANFLADSLGVSPLYRQEDTKRWQTAAKVYQSSRSQAHSPTSGTCAPQHFHFGESLTAESNLTQKIRQCRSSGSPISLEDIALVNRQFHRQMECGQRRRAANDAALSGSLELEAIAAVHELAAQVKQISVSEILPRTSDLIFLNIKTYDDHPYTLELTMKGWRVCSTHTDCMNGDYHNMALHTRYFQNAKDVLKIISPDHDKYFTDCLAQRLSQLQQRTTTSSSSAAAEQHDNAKNLAQAPADC